jgi:Flp pilus assembly protein TadG
VEFVIAIVPILTMFFSFVQLSRIATARLVVKHGAIVGARAAAVMTNGKDNTPDQPAGTNAGAVGGAVRAAIGPWNKTMAVNVAIDDASSRGDPYGWVEVKVTATYVCNVPLGFIACGGPVKRIEETYRMPHQGATYRMAQQ